MSMPTFSFIIVNYRSADCLPAWFESLIHTSLIPTAYEVIIINNDPGEQEKLCLLQGDYSFQLIQSKQNLGFGTAANQAAPHASGRYLVICNPDTRFIEGNLLEIPCLFDANPKLGIIGFHLLTAWSKPERWSTGRAVTLWEIIKNNLPLHIGKPLWENRKPLAVGWVSAAALVIPKALFEKIHGFDEGFFLYFEDADLCERVRQVGLSVLSYPFIKLRHTGGQSMPSLREQKCSYFQSQSYYFQKHRPKWENFLLHHVQKLFLNLP